MTLQARTLGVVLTSVMVGLVPGSVDLAAQASSGPAASPAAKRSVPRTPWGDPDLQGVYTNRDEMGIPLERPNQFEGKTLGDVTPDQFAEVTRLRREDGVKAASTFGGETGAGPVHWYEYYGAKNSRPWLITTPADGKIPPPTANAQTRAAELRAKQSGRGESDSAEDRSLYDRCISRGVPGSMMPGIYGNSYQIVQAPGYVAIRYEMIHETRIIPIDSRPHVGGNIRTYMGDARGHWEGNALVIETTNFNGRVASDIAGYGSPDRGASIGIRLIERFTPVADDKVEWIVTLDDAQTWARPWTFAMNLT